MLGAVAGGAGGGRDLGGPCGGQPRSPAPGAPRARKGAWAESPRPPLQRSRRSRPMLACTSAN